MTIEFMSYYLFYGQFQPNFIYFSCVCRQNFQILNQYTPYEIFKYIQQMMLLRAGHLKKHLKTDHFVWFDIFGESFWVAQFLQFFGFHGEYVHSALNLSFFFSVFVPSCCCLLDAYNDDTNRNDYTFNPKYKLWFGLVCFYVNGSLSVDTCAPAKYYARTKKKDHLDKRAISKSNAT